MRCPGSSRARRRAVLPFVKIGAKLVGTASITTVDLARIEALEVTVHHRDGVDVARDHDAIDVVMALRPSALEGKRMRFARRAWVIHNLLGHPGMQVLAWLGLRELGLRLHEATVPRGGGRRW